MSIYQKIYYNNKPLILAEDSADRSAFSGYRHLPGATGAHFAEAIKLLDSNSVQGVLITDPSRENLEKELLWAFYPIHSGGGVVLNEEGSVLMIFRRGKWDLPKGKQDEGEDIETCALREVREETGLRTVTLEKKICSTLHIYPLNQKLVLKYTSWYLMTGTLRESLLPQEEEKIEQAIWVKPTDIRPLLRYSFETIQDVLQEANIL